MDLVLALVKMFLLINAQFNSDPAVEGIGRCEIQFEGSRDKSATCNGKEGHFHSHRSFVEAGRQLGGYINIT